VTSLKLLITGGAGFLGSHVTRAALARESGAHQVIVMSRHPERVQDLPEGARLVQGDLTQAERLAACLRDCAPDAVIHTAAVVADHDPKLMQVNVTGTAALCAALSQLSPAPRLVHVSTFSVEDPPPTEYSQSKLAAEEVVRHAGLAHVILRPSLIYGAGDGTNTPALVEAMREGTVWLPGGGAVRIQPVHVEDVAQACLAAAERDDLNGHTYRLGGPEPVSVRSYREAMRDASGGKARVRALPLKLLDLLAGGLQLLGRPRARQVLSFHLTDHTVDSQEAARDLQFKPRSLAEGLLRTFPTT
jgi:nucleoside-diphosphate-sugar epimerase